MPAQTYTRELGFTWTAEVSDQEYYTTLKICDPTGDFWALDAWEALELLAFLRKHQNFLRHIETAYQVRQRTLVQGKEKTL